MYTFQGLVTFIIYFAAIVGVVTLFVALYYKDKK